MTVQGLNDAVIEAVSNMDTRKIQIKKTKKLKKSKFLYRKRNSQTNPINLFKKRKKWNLKSVV